MVNGETMVNNLDVEQKPFLIHYYSVEETLWEIDIYLDPGIVAEREFLHYVVNHQLVFNTSHNFK